MKLSHSRNFLKDFLIRELTLAEFKAGGYIVNGVYRCCGSEKKNSCFRFSFRAVYTIFVLPKVAFQ